MATAKTVLGEVPAKQLGRALCHEHLILAPSAAKDDEPDTYNVENLASKITSNASSAIQAHNIKTLVDVTPWTLGRDIELQQLVAKRLGINVIAATGFYQQQVGIPAYWHYQEEGQYEELMLRELTEGVSPGDNAARVKCGVIKIAWSATPPGDPEEAEEKATRAAARASRQTGAPIVAHCSWWGNPSRNLGVEQVKMLMEAGADPERIQISHCAAVAGNLAYLLDVVKTGAYVALPDSPLLTTYQPPQVETVAALIGGLVRAGHGHKVVMATDGIAYWYPKTPPGPAKDWAPLGQWNLVYEAYLPLLRAGGISEKELEMIMVENPARLFAW